MADDDPLSAALGELERRRRDRWIVAAVLVLAVVAAFAVFLVDDAAVPTAPWAAGGFLLVALVHGASVVVQERRGRRAVRALMAEREHLAALEARVAALETLHDVVRAVVAAEDLPGVFDRLLRGAADLTGAVGGAVLLRVGDVLTVAASEGAATPPLGTRLPEDDGAAWRAVRSGAAEVVAHATEWGMVAGASTLAMPLLLPGADGEASTGQRTRAVGALVVERSAEAPAFTSADRAAAGLFAEQAALAIRNASRLDRAEGRAASLAHDRTAAAERIRAVVDELRGLAATVTGTAQLLLHRGEGLPVARRHALLDGVLEHTSRQRELFAELDGLAQVDERTVLGSGAPEPPQPTDRGDTTVGDPGGGELGGDVLAP